MFFAGLLAGVLGGLGLGGGTLLIPILSLFTEHNQRTLQLYNLLFFFPTGIVALHYHNKNNLVDKNVFKEIIIFAIIGAIIGSRIAITIDVNVLRKLFGIFLIVLGINQIASFYK